MFLGATCADTASLTPKSAPAAIAHTLLSVTQHSRASEHDAATQSCCLVPPKLHAFHLPPIQVRHHFWAQHASIQYRSSGIQRPRHQRPRCSLRHSICQHRSIHNAKLLLNVSDASRAPAGPEIDAALFLGATYLTGADTASPKRRFSVCGTSIRAALCTQHPSTMPQRKAAA